MGGYFTTLKEKTLNETFPFVKAKLHSGKKKTLDYVSSLYYSKRAPIEKYGEECEDIEKIWRIPRARKTGLPSSCCECVPCLGGLWYRLIT